jgi:hypothetical protein
VIVTETVNATKIALVITTGPATEIMTVGAIAQADLEVEVEVAATGWVQGLI